MKFTDILKKVIAGRVVTEGEPEQQIRSFVVDFDSVSANFLMDGENLRQVQAGEGGAPVQEQLLTLELLCEQSDAERLANGYTVPADNVARLDAELARILRLPPRFDGTIELNVKSNTTSSRFDVIATVGFGSLREPISRTGPMIRVCGDEYILSLPALRSLEAIEHHRALSPSDRTEARNVELVARLQRAKELARSGEPELQDENFNPDLRQFERFTTREPQSVGVIAERQADGSLELTPDLGTGASPDQLNSRWHQLENDRVLRIESELLLLSEKTQQGVREVLAKRRIPKSQVKAFLQAPGDFLDPEIVDVDISFSMRVEGIGALVPVTFADAEQSGIDWFETVTDVLAPESLEQLVSDEEQLDSVKERVESAWEADEDFLPFEENVVDISDHERVERALEHVAAKYRKASDEAPPPPAHPVKVGMVIAESEDRASVLRRLSDDSAVGRHVDYSGLCKTPFSHQREGIEWLAGLMNASQKADSPADQRIQGALLADDMGLGKTFMTLVALREHLRAPTGPGQAPKPILAVLPLSLIENWETEIAETFESSPFADIVVLQAQRDLARFRRSGGRRETVVDVSALDHDQMVRTEELKLSLRVGEDYGEQRLDTPGRLVLTTYHALASYQLSLGQVEWGAVVFDEAQTIKNPETLGSRAAKGLKADFKLLATGTPVENSYKDIWNLLDTAQPGLLGPWTEFRKTWVKSSEQMSGEALNRHGEALRAEIGRFMLRRTKEDNLDGLPPKTVHTGSEAAMSGYEFDSRLAGVMPPVQLQAYDSVLDAHVPRSRGGALKTLQKLRSVSLHPMGVLSERDAEPTLMDSARTRALCSVLDDVQLAGEKAIIFVIDKKMQVKLASWLRERYRLPVSIVNGETQAVSSGGSETRRSIIRAFESTSGFNVIVMSPLAVGTGLTVVGANHAIHLERHWNPAKEAQATDRVHRIGQKRPVHVYLPLALHPVRKSFDLNLDALLQSKSDLKDAVVVPSSVEEELAAQLNLDGS